MKYSKVNPLFVIFFVWCLTIMAGNAHAFGDTTNKGGDGGNAVAGAAAGAVALAGGGHATVNGKQYNNQKSYQGNNQTAEQSAALDAQASQIVSFIEERRPVNAVNIPGAYSANDCMGSSSAAMASRLISIGGSTTWTNEECQAFKMAKDLDVAGMKEDALFLRCSVARMANAPSCVKLRTAVESVEQ